jgi:trans-aconitate methyltransferase
MTMTGQYYSKTLIQWLPNHTKVLPVMLMWDLSHWCILAHHVQVNNYNTSQQKEEKTPYDHFHRCSTVIQWDLTLFYDDSSQQIS